MNLSELPSLELCYECKELGYCKERRKRLENKRKKILLIPNSAPTNELPQEVEPNTIMVSGNTSPF